MLVAALQPDTATIPQHVSAEHARYLDIMLFTDLGLSPKVLEAIEAAGFKILETGNYPARPPNRFIVAERI